MDKRLGKYPPLFTDTEANNCFRYNTSLYQFPNIVILFSDEMGFARHFSPPEAARR